MPIYMDRHDVSEEVAAEHVAHLHQQDLAIQDRFGCRGLTYWFDEQRKTAFCLIEAPDEQSIREMHNHAHGDVPHRVIEVDPAIVESFLGRIHDPEMAQDVQLNIINDPAFRTIMVIAVQRQVRSGKELARWKDGIGRFVMLVPLVVEQFNGSIVKKSNDYFLASFRSVSNAVDSAMDLQQRFDSGEVIYKIGLSTGVPLTEKNLIFEEAIRLAERMTRTVKDDIIVSAEVRALYDSENRVGLAEKMQVRCLSPADEEFITRLMDHADKSWTDIQLKVDDLNKEVGYSKPQLYRKMIQLTGKSPITFIKEYRLNAALLLLDKGDGNVSQIAYETGFSSPSYFAKCFQKRYGLSPTEYLAVRQA